MTETGSKQQGKGGARPRSGRKPIGRQRSISIPDDLWEAAGGAASRAGMKRPDWLRHVIAEAAAKQPSNSD